MPDDEFKLPGSSYDLLEKIIMAYGEQDGPASTSDVAEVIDTHRTQVSRNNGFLLSVGVIEGGQAKEPTEQGAKLANALQYERERDIQRIWRQLLRGNEFIEKILSAVKVRKGMERSNLESHIAYTSGQKKSSRVLTGAGAVVDILVVAGFLEEKDGQLVVAGQLETPEEDGDRDSRPHGESPEEGRGRGTITQRIATKVSDGAPVVVQLQIQCSPEDLDDLAPKLRSFLDELAEDQDEDETDSAAE